MRRQKQGKRHKTLWHAFYMMEAREKREEFASAFEQQPACLPGPALVRLPTLDFLLHSRCMCLPFFHLISFSFSHALTPLQLATLPLYSCPFCHPSKQSD